jgi:hypothetical protein
MLQHQNLDVQVTRGFFHDHSAKRFVAEFESEGRRGDLDDLCGPEISKVMRELGWSFIEIPLCVRAVQPDGRILAMAWAGQTNLDDDPPKISLNLSWATLPSAQGRGLATALTAIAVHSAVMELSDERGPQNVMDRVTVHAQWRDSNEASHAVAAKLGLQERVGLGFSVDLSYGPVWFTGGAAPASELLDRHSAHGVEKLLKGFDMGAPVLGGTSSLPRERQRA